MMLGLFGWTAIAVTWPFALIAPWSIGLGPIGAHTVPFRLIFQAHSRSGEPCLESGLHRNPDRRPPDPWTASRVRRAIDTTARGRGRTTAAWVAVPRRTGVSRSRGVPRDRRTRTRTPTRVCDRDVVLARDRPALGRPRPEARRAFLHWPLQPPARATPVIRPGGSTRGR